jgi:hypothetical protein
VTLHVSDTLANTVPLVLGDRGEDREDQLADAVAGDIAAEVDLMTPLAISP